nr:hypothetical protein [Tanacetum cinerariifolium]
IEAVDSDGHLRSCPRLGVVDGGRRTRSCDRLAGPCRIRVGSWNIGSLTRKLLELYDALWRHKVDIACFQETKWKGSRAREGKATSCGTRDLAMREMVGLSDAKKKRFWDALNELVREFPTDQRLIIGGDLNGHIRAVADGYTGVYGRFGFGDRNEEGCTILEFATAHELVVVNSFFKKNDAHLITFHREAAETFRACVVEKLMALEEVMFASGTDQMWNTLAHVKKDVAKESLGVANETARTRLTHGESWWFCEEVQTKVTLKQSRFKELLSCREGNQEDIDLVKERYKVAKMEAKIAVANAKDKAYKDLYKKLDSKEGANDIYKIAKAEKDVRKRLGEYFSSFFNENPSDESRADVGRAVGSSSPHMHYECYYSRINKEKYEFVHQEMDIRIGDRIIQPKESIKYLGLVIHRSGRIIDDVAYRIRAGLVMMYGSECWPITKAQATRVEVAELRILRWICGKTMIDMIPNGVFRVELDVNSIVNKMRERRLSWFRHVKRRPRNASVRRVEAMEVEGSRRRGRIKLQWEDRLKIDMKELL